MLAFLEKWLLGRLIARLPALLAKFFGPVPNSIQGHVNMPELVRVVSTALLAGGGMAGLVAAIGSDLPAIFKPADAPLATAVVVLVNEVWRRVGHGAPLNVSVQP